MDETSLIRIDNMCDKYLEQNKSIQKMIKDGYPIPEKTFRNFISMGSVIFDFTKRQTIHSAVLDHAEIKLHNAWNEVQDSIKDKKPKAGPKRSVPTLRDAIHPKWKKMINATHDKHPCSNHPDMVQLHNATSEWDMNLDKLPVKREIVTGNGVTFKEHDISSLCNCQAHDVWQMQKVEYMAACQEAGKELPESFYVTGQPVA